MKRMIVTIGLLLGADSRAEPHWMAQIPSAELVRCDVAEGSVYCSRLLLFFSGKTEEPGSQVGACEEVRELLKLKAPKPVPGVQASYYACEKLPSDSKAKWADTIPAAQLAYCGALNGSVYCSKIIEFFTGRDKTAKGLEACKTVKQLIGPLNSKDFVAGVRATYFSCEKLPLGSEVSGR